MIAALDFRTAVKTEAIFGEVFADHELVVFVGKLDIEEAATSEFLDLLHAVMQASMVAKLVDIGPFDLAMDPRERLVAH